MRPSVTPEVSLFPMFLRIVERPCLVVGAGVVAEGKIASLLSAGARVTVIAPCVRRRILGLARRGRITLHQRKFHAADLAGIFLVIAATSSAQLHERICRLARRRGVLCNVVDDPPRCDFYCPAIVKRGSLQIAISTGGQSPALASQLRYQLEAQFGADYARCVADLGVARREVMRREPDITRRKRLAHAMASRSLAALQQSQAGGHRVL